MLAVVFALLTSLHAGAPVPQIEYELSIDSAHADVAHVAIALYNVPATFHLAMKVHAEYDARYWRFLDSLVVDGAAGAVATHDDSTVWSVSLPGGNGVVRYRVHIQPPAPNPSGVRRVWMPFARTDGAMINPPDFFLYVPELANAPVRVKLDLPASWRIATALPARGSGGERAAPNAKTLLDSPILAGNLRTWSFAEGGTTFHVAYWPEPNAGTFNDSAWVAAIHRIATQSLAVFGDMPSKDYWFLIEDGAGDALEHAASLTLGVPRADLEVDPQAEMTELAHEFFHTWNLVAIRPAGYNDLSYRLPARTPSLWIGEGVTMYYSDVLRRRASVTDSMHARTGLLAALLQHYYASPVARLVSPTRSSLAFPDSRATNPDATGGYYLQGQLLGSVLDAAIRDSTHDRRSLDDVMRAMYVASQRPGYNGYSSEDFERTADSVCGCRMNAIFAGEVRGDDVIDVSPVLGRIGLRMVVDTLPANAPTPGQTPPALNVRVRFEDVDNVTPRERQRRAAWLEGRG